LVGDQAQLEPLLRSGAAPSNVQIHHSTQSIEMGESAAAAIRTKKDSSLRVSFELLKAGKVDAMVSAGHSGAMLAGALLLLGRLDAVERPAIAALLPGRGDASQKSSLSSDGGWLLLDAGANVQCRPNHLVQFAVMGEAYMRQRFVERFQARRPRVALLANGEEDSKGTELTREVLQTLRRSDLDLVGYVEGKDLFSGLADVVVTDGFTGNVVLKTSEGTATALFERVRSEIDQLPWWRKWGGSLLRPAMRRVRQMADYAEYGGAPLLGVDGVALVAHGRSSAKAFESALKSALATAEGGFLKQVSERLESARAWNAVVQS
jgi:glycerol-3-phosphate acyltransferase PlsX